MMHRRNAPCFIVLGGKVRNNSAYRFSIINPELLNLIQKWLINDKGLNRFGSAPLVFRIRFESSWNGRLLHEYLAYSAVRHLHDVDALLETLLLSTAQ